MSYLHIRKLIPPKGIIIYIVPKVCNLESELEPKSINVQHRALSFMPCTAHPIHFELSLCLYTIEGDAEPSGPLFRSGLDVLMTLYLPRMGDGVGSRGQDSRHCLEAFPLFSHGHIFSFYAGVARLNQISLSKPTIIKFISPGDFLIIFPFVTIFDNNQRHSVRSGFRDN